MYETIMAALQALFAWLKYSFDPEMVKRRDEINKLLAEDGGYDSVDKLLAGKNTLGLTYFFGEYMRRMRTPTDPATRRAADLLIGVLPQPRSQQDRDKDTTEGF